MSLDRIRRWALATLGTEHIAAELEHWSGLFRGDWRLVDQFDRGGRRYLVAERQRGGGRISPADWPLLEARALGTQVKVIALDSGLSESTVSRRLRQAMAKLGVRSQAELARLFARPEGDSEPLAPATSPRTSSSHR